MNETVSNTCGGVLDVKGKCGDTAFWDLDGETLTISGSGKMDDYERSKDSPFNKYKSSVAKIVIEEGITGIGNNSFTSFEKLKDLSIPGSAEIIGHCAFSTCSSLEKLHLPEGVRVIGPKSFEKCASLMTVSLPSTLRAVDFKAFKGSDAIEKVTYNGTKAQWKRCIRISTSANGNATLCKAKFKYASQTCFYRNKTSELAEIIKNGGDGKMYVVVPNLTIKGMNAKSGDCAIIILPNGQTMMIDSGFHACGGHVMRLVRSLKMKRLDYFVLSHPHADHIGNAIRVSEYFNSKGRGGVKTYWHSGIIARENEENLSEYLAAHGTELVRNIRAGDQLLAGGVRVDIFNPLASDVGEKELGSDPVNNSSLAMKFTYGKSTFMTCGDLYADREKKLAEIYGNKLQTDVVKANHHSCYTSNTEEWYDSVAPKIIISHCDDNIWTVFEERLARKHISHYRVSDHGLTVVSMDDSAGYIAHAEFEGR